jgi:manganese-dependent inorganic pyrophosphatase
MVGMDADTLGEDMFEAAEDLEGKTGTDILYQDFKVFSAGKVNFAVGQVSFLGRASRALAKHMVEPLLEEARQKNGVDMLFFLVTDIRGQSSCVLFTGEGAESVIRDTFPTEQRERLWLPGLVSRKKQFVPPVIAALSRR